jgi:hypothetical protein
MKKAKLLIIFFLFIISFLIITAGCEEMENFYNRISLIKRVDICLNVGKDGTGDLKLKFLFAEGKLDFKEDVLKDLEKRAVENNFKIQPYYEGNSNGIIVSANINLIAEDEFSTNSGEEILDLFQNNFLGTPLLIEKNFFSTDYEFSSQIGPVFLSENRFILEMPGKYQDHNADRVENNKLIWDLDGYRDIKAQSRSINIIPVIIIIIGSLVLLLLIVILLKRIKILNN